MRNLVHVPLTFVLVYCALWYVEVATAEVKTTSGTATVDFVELHTKNLVKCREAANETLQQIKCYELAVIHMQSNFSHWSSLALLYLRADLGVQAHEVMNQSVHYWLKYLEPHLNASGKDLSTTQMRWVDVLRFHFDLGVDNKTWFREEAVEMGFLLAKKFEIEHLPSDAHSVYYEFLLQTGAGESQAMDFHRRTGNVLALALSGPQNDSSVVFRIAEAVQPAIDGLVEHVLNKGPGTFDPPLRRMCGVEFNNGDELLLRDLVRHIDECVARWGNMTETLQLESDGPKDAPALNQWSGSMRETAMHRLAVAGATGTLRAIFESYPDARDVKIRADRFGRTLTHMAAAWGHESTLQLLLERGGDINTQDAGGLSPRHLGCDSPGFQETFIKLNRDKTVCEGYTRDKIIDDDADVTDDSGTDGGWNPRFKRPKYLHCDFDVRDAARITQSDLLAAYTHSNQPVVLRNSFYETDGPDFRWSKKKFNRTYGHMLIRQEYFARQSRWGLGGIVNVSNVTEWLDTLDENDGKIATVNVDLVNHPLAEIADSWVPPSLVNKKRTDEIEFFDVKVTVPTVHLNKRGSKSNHYIRAQSMFHTVVYGHQEWVLLPPRDARTLRDVLPEKLAPLAKRCELMTGDVLIIPDLWSASWVSKNNGVSMERYFYKKARSG